MTDHDFVLAAVRQANPRSAGAAGPDGEWSTSELFLQIEQRSGTMTQASPQKDQPTSPDRSTTGDGVASSVSTRPASSRRRRSALVGGVAFIAALVIGVGAVVMISGDDVDVAEVEPGPISSFEDIAGTTYERQGPGSERYLFFFEDGTFHGSSNRDLVVDSPSTIDETRFDATTVFLHRTSCAGTEAIYEIHLLENGNLKFVAIDDTCGGRSGLSAEWASVP